MTEPPFPQVAEYGAKELNQRIRDMVYSCVSSGLILGVSRAYVTVVLYVTSHLRDTPAEGVFEKLGYPRGRGPFALEALLNGLVEAYRVALQSGRVEAFTDATNLLRAEMES
jgi:hypothetical protein